MWTTVLFCVCIVIGAAISWWLWRARMRRLVRIAIQGVRVLEVHGGDDLLSTLARNGFDLPSTCGGKGSCARCRCRVVHGGGRITDRERPYFTRDEVAGRWRLACQVKVYGDMTVQLPEEGEVPPPARALRG